MPPQSYEKKHEIGMLNDVLNIFKVSFKGTRVESFDVGQMSILLLLNTCNLMAHCCCDFYLDLATVDSALIIFSNLRYTQVVAATLPNNVCFFTKNLGNVRESE